MLYTDEILQTFAAQTFAYLKIKEEDNVLTIRLSRAHKKNALNPVLVNELAFAMNYAHYNHKIWAVVLEAEGDVFCAGADLKAFMGMQEEYNSTIPAPKEEVLIGELFKSLHKPCIAKLKGHVLAGGFLLIAGCTHVVSSDHIRLGLPEVKRGLFPYQVMASLLEIMPARKVLDWSMRAYDLPLQEALQYGLVTEVVKDNEVDQKVESLIKDIKENSPTAIRMGLKAYSELNTKAKEDQHMYLKGMLMQTIQTKDAQEGILAFKEKRKAVWSGE